MSADRQPPRTATLVRVLDEHGVRFVVHGSTAAMLHGVEIRPGDLDIVPATDVENLRRLSGALAAIDARPDPDGPFGDWRRDERGEWAWVQREPRSGEREARIDWRPDPADPDSFDHQLATRYGAVDIVPMVSGTYAELAPRAVEMSRFGPPMLVASIADLLATITVPRRAKDIDRVRQLRALSWAVKDRH